MMISIKKKRRSSSKNIDTTTKESITLRQQIKELIDIIGYREQPIYRECCLDDICKVLQEHIDAKIHNWIESFEHNQLKEKERVEKADCQVFYDIHHSMKVYSNGAAHALQFLKDELVEK